MVPVLVTPPAALLALPLVKAHLRVDPQVTDEDTLIAALMDAAVSFLDGWSGYLGRCILPQVWATAYADFSEARLPFPDAASPVITYLPADGGVAVTLSSSAYRLEGDALSAKVVFDPAATSGLALAPRDDAVRIEAKYGWTEAPGAILVAALMMIAYWFADREASAEIPPAAIALLRPFRRIAA